MGFWAHGTVITVDSTPVGGCTGIGLPEQSKSSVEITAHDSGGWREFVAGLREGGTVSLSMCIRATDAGQQALYTNFLQDNTNMAVEIAVPADPLVSGSAFTISFDAYAESTGGDLPFDDAGEMTFTLRIVKNISHSLISV